MQDRVSALDKTRSARIASSFAGGLTVLVACVGVAALLERLGLPAAMIAPGITVLAIGSILAAALAGRSMTVFGFDLARQHMPVTGNMLAITTVALALLWISPDPLAVATAVPAALLAVAIFLSAGWRRSGASTLAQHMRWRRGGRVATLVLAVTSAAVALLAAGGLCVAAQIWLEQAFGSPALPVALTAAVIVAVAAVPGGLRSVSSAQLAAAGAVIVSAVACALLWAAERREPALAEVTQPVDGVWMWLSAFCGTLAFPALFPRFASARTPGEAQRAGVGAALLTLAAALSPVLALPAVPEPGGLVTLSTLFSVAAAGVALTAAALLALTVARLVIGLGSSLERADRPAAELPASRRLLGTRLLILAMAVGIVVLPDVIAGRSRAELPGLAMLWAWSLAAAGVLPLLVMQASRLPVSSIGRAVGMLVGIAFATAHLAGVRLPLDPYPLAAAGPLGALIAILVTTGWAIVGGVHRAAMDPVAQSGPEAGAPAPDARHPTPQGAAGE